MITSAIARLEGWTWAVLLALVLLASGCWVYRAHVASDDDVRVQLSIKNDSLVDAVKVRDSVNAALENLKRYAAAQHEIAELAVHKADSLTGYAERHRARVRVIDATHVSVTASDSQRVAEVHDVPVQVTEQLTADSASMAALDDALAKKQRELTVQLTADHALIKAVTLDSTIIRTLQGENDVLRAAKTPRLTFREGILVGGLLALTVKLLAVLLIH